MNEKDVYKRQEQRGHGKAHRQIRPAGPLCLPGLSHHLLGCLSGGRHAARATVSDMGPELLSRILGLTAVQELSLIHI